MGKASDKGGYLYARVNEELKEGFREFCNKKGVNLTTALHYFMMKSLDEGRLPFSRDELYMIESRDSNGEAVARVSLRVKRLEDKANFEALCDKHSVSMSGAVKLYFKKCIELGDYPF